MLTMVRPIFSILLSLRHDQFYHQRPHATILKSMTSSESTSTPKRIFCFGDSLTAGTAPPLDGLYPYGKMLESELGENFVVRWRGLPGWTAQTMVEYLDDGTVGLRAAVNGIDNPPLSLVIILAGTNDIGFLTSSMTTGGATDINTAVKPILDLHRACLDIKKGDHKIRTLAVGIPGSAWQQMNTSASKLAAEMNSSIQEFAQSYPEGMVSYTDFPFPFERNDLWCSDGTHLSPNGYTRLGKELAPVVKHILERRN
jgi:lysophospholipase L1-like esterase